MYIHKTKTRTKNEDHYFTFRLVESERKDGKVGQKILLNLGSNFSLSQEKWTGLCDRITQTMTGQSSLFQSFQYDDMRIWLNVMLLKSLQECLIRPLKNMSFTRSMFTPLRRQRQEQQGLSISLLMLLTN